MKCAVTVVKKNLVGLASTLELLYALVRTSLFLTLQSLKTYLSTFKKTSIYCFSGCSGVHRSLGVHYSKVRSLTLDQWEPEILKVMAELGNAIVNRAYQANVDPDFIRASPNCSSPIRENWIKAKYVERKFVKQLPVSPSDYRSSRPTLGKKWTVRRLRRRPQSRDSRGSRHTRFISPSDKLGMKCDL